ncbi:MAG: DUF2842 domain-containing protein [Pseudomonadota bacterium]|nr:DUF2842 domain-containing protein [Pseudomonadota bacterium]
MRKIVGAFAIVAFMVAYIWAAIAIGERLPENRAVQLIYFIVAGMAWGLPLFPLIAWAQRSPDALPRNR